MNIWENNLYGFVRKEDWIDVGNLVPTRQNDPIDRLFGDRKTDNLVAQWESLAAEYQIPMMAQFHGFDTEAQTTFRIPVDTHSIEKGLIKVKINQSERLRALARSGVQGDQALYNYILDDGARLADQVITRTKVAKNELMAYGKVTIKENNLDLDVTYGVPSDQIQYEIDLDAEADVPGQIQAIIDAALEKGVTINGMLTSRKNISKMRKNKYLQTSINGIYAQGQYLSQSQLENFLGEEFGIDTVIENDLKYGASSTIVDGRPSIAQRRYYPEDRITFFATNPGGRMGIGLWGDSPEADAAKFYEVKRSGQSPYVYIEQWMEKDPAVLWTKASSLFMPVLYNPFSLFIATVKEPTIQPSVIVTPSTASVVVGATTKLAASVVPEGAEVTWASSDATTATVSGGTVTGVKAGSATISASITVDETTYSDICNVTVSAGA